MPTDATGDCLIDAFAIFAGRARNPITWKSIRDELGDFMLYVANQADMEGDDSPWAACFRLCGEDEIMQRLHAAPHDQKGAISGWSKGVVGGSSLCSPNKSHLVTSTDTTVTAAPGDTGITASKGSHAAAATTEEAKKHTLDSSTLQAGSLAGILQEAAAVQPACGEKQKPSPDVCDNGSSTAYSSSDATPVKAASSTPDAATTAAIKKETHDHALLKAVKVAPVFLLLRRSPKRPMQRT